MSLKSSRHASDIDDAFAAEARRCGFGGMFNESSLPHPLDRPFTHHRRQIEAFISGIDRVRSTRVRLAVAFAFADSPVFNAFASTVQRQHFIGVPFGTVLLLYDVFLRVLATRDAFPTIGEPRAERKHRRYDLLPLSAIDLPLSRRNPIGIAVVPTDPVRHAYANYLVDIVFAFLFAHEYQHIEGGHLGWLETGGSAQIIELGLHRLSTDEALDRQTLEADADAAATNWSLKMSMDRSNDHWRVPKSLTKLLETDRERLRAWLLAVGVLFHLMQEHRCDSLDLEQAEHPPALMRHYFTVPAAEYILGGHPSARHLESLSESTLADVYAAFDSIAEKSRLRKVIPADFSLHINRIITRWANIRRELSPIAAAWGGSNAPDEYFELLPDELTNLSG